MRRSTRAALAAVILLAALASVSAKGAEAVVAIDPGHGGIDPGASAGGLVEKSIVLDFARQLAGLIDEKPGLRAYLVREDDSFLTLRERIRRARDAGANLIVSLHADTTELGVAEGAHVYTLSAEASDEAAVALAERENRSDIIGGVPLAGESDDLAGLLVDLARRGTADEDEKLANALIEAMDGEIPLLATAPHRTANFRILKAPELPSVLVELGYMSNKSDRERLQSEAWRARAAAAIAQGIALWSQRASPGFLEPKR
jgi:N-acetylmuramoyl-L-alanine amidase